MKELEEQRAAIENQKLHDAKVKKEVTLVEPVINRESSREHKDRERDRVRSPSRYWRQDYVTLQRLATAVSPVIESSQLVQIPQVQNILDQNN
jgi:hypothetical protein